MGNLGFGEIMLILGVAVLLFGAGRIADVGKGLGQGIKNFKQGLKEGNELDDDKKKEAEHKRLPERVADAPSPTTEDKAGKAS